MRHAKTLITTAEVIQHVFNIPVILPWRPSFRHGLPCRTSRPSARHFSFANPCAATYKPVTERSAERLAPRREIDPLQFGPKSQDGRPPRDTEIRHWQVVIRLPDGKLSEVTRLQEILDGRMKDEKGKYSQYVQLIAEADASMDRPYPIVGYFGKREGKEKELAARKKEKEATKKEKSIELSWSISDHDLLHRMDKLQAFLQKGKKVEILFGSKGWRKIKRVMSEDEAQSTLDKIRKAAIQVEGAQVIKEFDGALLREGRIVVQGPLKTSMEENADAEEKMPNVA